MNRLDILTELSGLDPELLKEAEEYKPEILPENASPNSSDQLFHEVSEQKNPAVKSEMLLMSDGLEQKKDNTLDLYAASKKKKYIYIATAAVASLLLLFGIILLKQGSPKEKSNTALPDGNGGTAIVSPDESIITQSITDVKRAVYYCDGKFDYYRRFEPNATSNIGYFENYEGKDLAEALHIDMNIPAVRSGLYTADHWSGTMYSFSSESGGKIRITLFAKDFSRTEKYVSLETRVSEVRGREVEIIKKETDGAAEYVAYYYMGNHGVSLELSGEENEDILLETLDYMIAQAEIHERDFNEPSHIKEETEEEYYICLNVVKK